MRILQVVSSVDVACGGVARAVLDASFALANAGVHVEILAHKGGSVDAPWGNDPPPNLTLTLVDPPRSRRLISPAMRQCLPLAIKRCNVAHLHGMWELLNTRAAQAALAAKKPYVCTPHGMLDPWCMAQHGIRKRIYLQLFDRQRLASAHAVHVTADNEADAVRNYVKVRRIEVVPCILDLSPYEKLPPKDAARARFPRIPNPAHANSPWILFLSRLHEKKGLHLLIDAFAKLPPSLASAQLVIAGPGDETYLNRLREQVRKRNLTARAHFLGTVQGEAKVALYRSADILCIPTSQENFGLVFPEALACETPVATTKGVGIWRDLLTSGGGLLIDQNPEHIAAILAEALADPATLRNRGIAGRIWVMKHLQAATIAARWVTIYNSIMNPHMR